MASKQPKTKLLRLLINELAVHPTAQRAIIPAHLKRINETLDLDAIGTLHAVRYPIRGVEKYWLVDGQHRWQVLKDAGLGDLLVSVMLHEEVKDDAGANRLFLLLNVRKGQSANEIFNAQLRARYPDAVGVAQVCHKLGIKIKPAPADGSVACVSRLLKIWKHDSGKTLWTALEAIRDAWGFVSASLEGVIVEGLSNVLMQHSVDMDLAALVAKLAKYPGGAGALHGDAKGRRSYRRRSVSQCVSEIIVEIYNSGRRSGKLK